MDWKAIAAMVALVTLANGGFVWAVKTLLAADRKKLSADLKSITDNACKLEARHEKLQSDFDKLKEDLPEKYVRREDWIISFSHIQQRLDSIWTFINEKIASGKW